ncbi:MAG: hypothetical protein WAK33_00035 [Silvibacterium sp.]
MDDSSRHKADKELLGDKKMASQNDSQGTPKVDQSKTSDTSVDERLDHAAEEAAEKAGRTEQRYDSRHDIFTK